MKWILYKILYAIAMIVILPVLPFSRKIREGYFARWSLFFKSPSHFSSTLWFHVASTGELEQCLPLMDYVRETRPELSIYLTYFSPTARGGIEAEKKRRELSGRNIPWNAFSCSPFDLNLFLRPFLKRINPLAFIAIHRELWPGILLECRRQNIPRFLAAAYFGKGKFDSSLRLLTGISVTDSGSQNKIDAFGLPSLVTGDPRIERVLARQSVLGTPLWAPYFKSDKKTFVMGSVWDEDFKVLSEALREVPGLRLVVVPHEMRPEFLSTIEKWFGDHSLPLKRWSQWLKQPEVNSHLLVDQVGFLAELYSIADFSFVGGSFKARVHNILEPAIYQRAVLTGPLIENSREARQLSREPGFFVCKNAFELKVAIQTAVSSQPALYFESLLSERGASKRTIDFILEKLSGTESLVPV